MMKISVMDGPVSVIFSAFPLHLPVLSLVHMEGILEADILAK